MYEAEIKNQRIYKYVLIIMVIAGIGLLGALIYLFFYLRSSPDSIWHILPPSIAMIVYIFIVIGIANRLVEQNKQLYLLKNGVTASAKILDIKDTGMTVNDDPKVNLLLEITVKSGTKYKCQTQHIITRLDVHKYSIGTSLTVKISESNSEDIVIEGIRKI